MVANESSTRAPKDKIVVLGAGVIGLTVAVELQERYPRSEVSMIAEYFPGDRSIEYCSAWAGAHHVSFASLHDTPEQTLALDLDRITLAYMWSLLQNDPSVPLMRCKHIQYYEEQPEPGSGPDMLKVIYPGYREFGKSELPPGCIRGCEYESLTIDSAAYLSWLHSRFEKNGGKFARRKLKRFSSAVDEAEPPRLCINCTGLGAATLAKDSTVYPTRGQTVLVRAPWVKEARSRSRGKGLNGTYIIPRKSGIVILGGCRGDNDWHPEPREDLREEICRHCVELMPELLPEGKREHGDWRDLDVVDQGCGLRPSRKGGVRIEHDVIRTVHGNTVPLIHCYGHSGAGFQASYGSAQMVLKLAADVLG